MYFPVFSPFYFLNSLFIYMINSAYIVDAADNMQIHM